MTERNIHIWAPDIQKSLAFISEALHSKQILNFQLDFFIVNDDLSQTIQRIHQIPGSSWTLFQTTETEHITVFYYLKSALIWKIQI